MATKNIAPLPAVADETVLVRTCFDDPAAWDRLRAGVATPSPGDGFLAVVRKGRPWWRPCCAGWRRRRSTTRPGGQ